MVLTALAEPLPAFTNICRKLIAPTKSVAGCTTLFGELISLEQTLAVFISLSRMVAAHVEPLLNFRYSWGD